MRKGRGAGGGSSNLLALSIPPLPPIRLCYRLHHGKEQKSRRPSKSQHHTQQTTTHPPTPKKESQETTPFSPKKPSVTRMKATELKHYGKWMVLAIK